MSVLSDLTRALDSATVEIIDLTAPLSASTPILKLPEPFGNTVTFALHEISRYDERGPAWSLKSSTTAGAISLPSGTCDTSSPSRPVTQCTGASK